MTNITFIGSIINTPNKQLSYSETRSDYSRLERYLQTKDTIKSVREKMPNTKIILVECSLLSEDELLFFKSSVDYFINLYDLKDKDPEIIEDIYSIHKGLGERLMTLYAFLYLFENNIKYDNFYKITGRYKLNDNFDEKLFNNKYSTIIIKTDNTISSAFYKLNYDDSLKWCNFLTNNKKIFMEISAEFCLNNFINSLNSLIYIKGKHEDIGITLFVAIKKWSYE